jgi:Zn ribbon nucleic-acid-binding protein
MLFPHAGRAMPDQRGRLTPGDHEKIRDWWLTRERWKAPVVCPVCQTTEWRVLDYALVLNRYGEYADVSGTPSYPVVAVGCVTCAHTMLFNAVMIGITGAYDPKNDPTVLAALPKPSGS